MTRMWSAVRPVFRCPPSCWNFVSSPHNYFLFGQHPTSWHFKFNVMCAICNFTSPEISLQSHLINVITIFNVYACIAGHAMAQLVEALRRKPEGPEFESWWFLWNFSFTWSFRPHSVPGVDSAPNRNDYQYYLLGGKGGRCVGLTTLPPSCADCL